MHKHLSCTLSRLSSSEQVTVVRVSGCLPGLHPIHLYWFRTRMTDRRQGKVGRNADHQSREAIAPALAGYLLRGTQRVAARRAECHDKTRRNKGPCDDCLGVLALIQHALHVTVRIKFNSISARYWTSVQCRALTVVTAVVSVVCPFGTGAVQGFFDPDQKVVLTGSNLRCWNRVALKPVTAKCRARFAPRKGRHCSARRQCPA